MITYDSIAAMKMNRALFSMNNRLNNINKQLKTGSSINRAADNPAVYNYIAKVKNYSDFYSVTNQNAQTGISMIDAGLESISSMQNRLKEIKTLLTSANAVLSASQRDSIQSEIDSLTQKIADTRTNTNFNGLQLFELQGQYDGVPTDGYNYTSDYHQLTVSDLTNIQTAQAVAPQTGSDFYQLTIGDFENVQTLYAEEGGEEEEEETEGFRPLTIDDFDDLSTDYFGGVEFQTGYYDFGNMSPDYCYLIEDVDQLKAALNSSDNMAMGHEIFVILNDIDCSDLMGDWGSYTNNCVIEGNGHVIRNLTYDDENCSVALVSDNWGEIRNLGIENCSFSGYDASGICGNNYGTISNCYVDSCYIYSNSEGSYSGGICGNLTDNMGSYSTTVSNCYVTNTTISKDGSHEYSVPEAGGIVGYLNSGNIENCYVTGCTIQAENYSGGIIGEMSGNMGTNISNCFAIDNSITQGDGMYSTNGGAITGNENMGGMYNNYQDFDSMDIYSTYQETSWFASSDAAYYLNQSGMNDTFEYIEGNDHPTLKSQSIFNSSIEDPGEDPGEDWSIFVNDYRYGEYDGQTYYFIENADQFMEIIGLGESTDKKFLLLSDINLSGKDGCDLTNFAYIDGNGHKLTNYSCYRDCEFSASLMAENCGTIKNLGFENFNLEGNYVNTAVICDYNRGTIDNCYIKNSSPLNVNDDMTSGNGFCVNNYGTISNSYIVGSTIGGDSSYSSNLFCGYNEGTIENCFGYNNTTSGMELKDVSGNMGGYISNCYADVDATDYFYYRNSYWFTDENNTSTLGSAFMYDSVNNCPILKMENPSIGVSEIGLSTDIRYGEYNGQTYYLIENVNQFNEIISSLGASMDSDVQDFFSSKKFMLTTDLDLTDIIYEGDNVNYAYIDGNGHKIRNYTSTQSLFSANYGTIKNLGLENCEVTGNDLGIFVGDNEGIIDSCFVKNSSLIIEDYSYSGLFSGLSNNGTFSNCYVANCSLSGENSNCTGQFSGDMNSNVTFENCFVFNCNFEDSGDAFLVYNESGSESNCHTDNYSENDEHATYHPSEWFASEDSAAVLGDAFEYVRGDNHITLKWENAGRSVNIPGVSPLKDNSIRIQTGKNPSDYVTIDTTFYFDNNFNFDASSQENAVASLAKLQTVSDNLTAKTTELNSYRKALVAEANYSLAKVNAANKTINAWTGVDKDELQAKKEQLLSDIINAKSLRDQTIALNQQMCQMLILGAINSANRSFSLYSPFSSNDWLTNLLSV